MSAPIQDADDLRLTRLFRARHPLVFIRSSDEDYAFNLVRAVARDAKLWLRAWSLSRGLYNAEFQTGQPVGDTESPDAALAYLIDKYQENTVIVFQDLIQHFESARTLRLARDLVRKMRESSGHLVLVDHKDGVPPALEGDATRFEISLPDEKDLERLVRKTLEMDGRRLNARVKISREAWRLILRNLRGLTRRQAEQVIRDALADDQEFVDGDVNTILARKRRLLHKDGLLEYVESLARLDDVAGFTRLKEWLKQRNEALSDEAVAYGLTPPRGILMLGVPGAGKSFCAKAVAAAWHRPLLRLDPSVLYDKFIGESERRLREALQQAEAMAPIILWIDEIEKGFSSAASRSVDGGLSQRMFGTLLTWMQEHREPVFLIATANDIEALPPELLRKGRFDEIFFVDLPTEAVRREVFVVHLRKRNLDPDKFDLDALAGASEGRTGAEIEQAIISGLYASLAAKRKPDTQAVLAAVRESPPLSVTMAEHVSRLRAWAKDRCVPVD